MKDGSISVEQLSIYIVYCINVAFTKHIIWIFTVYPTTLIQEKPIYAITLHFFRQFRNIGNAGKEIQIRPNNY